MPLRKDIFDPSGQVDPNSELAKRTAQEQAYGQFYEKALGTLQQPQMGAKYMQGPEGQLWQGIEQQRQFGMAQAGRRGFNPFAARGATQAGSEMESQGYGAAQGIREQQDYFAKQAALGLAQQRSAYDQQQAGIDTAGIQQKMQQQLWEQAQKQQLDAEQQARQNQAFMGGLNAFQSSLGMITSDENMKTDITDGGPAADALMDSIARPSMTREEAIKYWNTPIGASADQVQMVGEWGNKYNPRTAIVYTGAQPAKSAGAVAAKPAGAEAMPYLTDKNFDEEYGAASDGQRKLMQPLAMPIKGIAISDLGEGGPANTMSQGIVVPSQELGMSVRGMSPERRAKAEAALGITRPIDPRAQAYVQQQMPKASAFIANPPISDYEYGVVSAPVAERTAADIAGKPVLMPSGTYLVPTQELRPETPEQALRRREADRRAAMIADALNSQSNALEAKANRPAKQKEADLASMMNDYAKSFSKSLGGGGIVDQALNNAVPYSFDYKAGVGAPGRQLGVMAQDVANNPLTNAMVTPTPAGLAINPAKAVGPLLGMAGRLNQRVSKLEKGK